MDHCYDSWESGGWLMYVGIYVHPCMHVCMYVCVHVCVHACMHACMNVYQQCLQQGYHHMYHDNIVNKTSEITSMFSVICHNAFYISEYDSPRDNLK